MTAADQSSDPVRVAAAAMSEAFRTYTGTKPGDDMWNLNMEKTWDLVAPAVVDALAAAGHLPPADAPTEWSIRYPDGWVDGVKYTEAGARHRATQIEGAIPVRRNVGPWQPVNDQKDQP